MERFKKAEKNFWADLRLWAALLHCVWLQHCCGQHSRTPHHPQGALLLSAAHPWATEYICEETDIDQPTVRGRHVYVPTALGTSLQMSLCGIVCIYDEMLPVIRGIHGPPVSFPADDRLRQAMDLALKSSNTSQLCTHRTWLHMKICHCWEQKRQRDCFNPCTQRRPFTYLQFKIPPFEQWRQCKNNMETFRVSQSDEVGQSDRFWICKMSHHIILDLFSS